MLELSEYVELTGETMDVDTFQRQLYLAKLYVNLRTFGRVERDWPKLSEPTKEKVKFAVAKTIEWLQSVDFEVEKIKSETVGPHSVTYEHVKNGEGLKVNDVIEMALRGTGLLYRGFGRWRL